MKKIFLLLFTILNIVIASYSQAPGHVPYSDPEQVELTPINILFFIVVPIIILISFFIMRRRKKKK